MYYPIQSVLSWSLTFDIDQLDYVYYGQYSRSIYIKDLDQSLKNRQNYSSAFVYSSNISCESTTHKM